MADFRDSLRTVRITVDGRTFDAIGASFRGVPFFVESSERSGGRRVVVHEFPLRDDPFVEDLGRRARKFRIDGYVLGADYVAQRDRLLAAIEDEEGPGQLIHPYHGLRSAIGETVSVRETRADGGMAIISVEFCEAPAQAPTPAVVDDLPGKVSTSANNALLSCKAELGEKYSAAGMPAFALASAETALTSAAGGVLAKLAPAAQAAASVAGGTAEFAALVTQDIATLSSRIQGLTAQAAALVRAPAELIDGFQAAIDSVADAAAAAPGAIMNALLDAYGVDLGPATVPTTATRARELANQQALTGALRRVLAIEAARLAPLVPYVSIDDATAARDRVAAALDEQSQGAGDTAYPALVDLRAQVMRAVPGTDVFPRVIAITRRTAVPSLVLAYQLYGSVDLELDVVARNRVSHPGFIAGDLKVLSNGR